MLKRIALMLLFSLAVAAPGWRRPGRPSRSRSWCRSAPARRPTSSRASSPTGCGKKYPDSAFVVENKPGASGNIGTDAVAKAAPDGATIGVSIGGPLAINTLLFSKLPYDPQKDIAPITQLITQPSVLAVNPELKVNIGRRAGRAAESKIPANTTSPRSATARCRISRWRRSRSKSGTKIVHVPYPSSPAGDDRGDPRRRRRWPACRRSR